MSLKVLFLHYHGIGHLNPCFAFARILLKHQYEVVFAGSGFFKDHVSAEGFPFYPLRSVPFGLGFEKWVNTIEKKKYAYLSNVLDRITDRLYKTREKELVKLLADISPDIVILDATQATDIIVLYPHLKATPIRVAVIHAMFPTHVLPGRPPANSDVYPEDEKAVEIAVRSLHLKRYQNTLRQKLKYFFHDDSYLIRRRLRKNRFPHKYRSELSSLFYFNIGSLPEFILAPREFDFPTFETPPFHHYLGFMKNRPLQISLNNTYTQAKSDISKRKLNENTRLLYCSFGTIEPDHQDVIVNFLNRLIKVTEDQKYLLLISVSLQEEYLRSITNSQRVYLFRSVPQLDVLTYADLFITHGGLGSIKESILANVPMLMYPVHTDYDPIGNAARVEYHGLGLRGNAYEDSESTIRNRIVELLTNQAYTENVRKMSAVNEKYTEQRLIELMSKLRPVD